MGKCDEALHGVGVSGPALRNDFLNVGSSSCQYPTDSFNCEAIFWYIWKAFQRQTSIMGVFVKTNVIIGGCICQRYEALQRGGGGSQKRPNIA